VPDPCDLCGGTDFAPWAEDTALPMCTACGHVCAHKKSVKAPPRRWRMSRGQPRTTMKTGPVYVGRPSKWGNPYRVGVPWPPGDPPECQHPATHGDVVAAYEDYVAGRMVDKPPFTLDDIRAELGGRDLICWCRLNQACHAETLLRLANEANA
jgi:hypothetical protein